jgi:hypothetical protein
MAKQTERKNRYTKTEVGGGVKKPGESLMHNGVSETEGRAPIHRQPRSTTARKRGSVHILLADGQRVILPNYSKPCHPEESDQQNINQRKSLDRIKSPPPRQRPSAVKVDNTSTTAINTTNEKADNKTNGDGIEIVWQSRSYQYLAVVLGKKSTSSVRLQTVLRYAPEVQVPLKETAESGTRRLPPLKPSRKRSKDNSTRRGLFNNDSLLDEESSTSSDEHDYESDDEVSSEFGGSLGLIPTLTACALTPAESSSERLWLGQSHLKHPIHMFRITSSSSSTEIWDGTTSATTASSSGTSEMIEQSSTDTSPEMNKGCCIRNGGWFRCAQSM